MDLMRKSLAGAAIVLITQYARSAKADEGMLPTSDFRGTRASNSEQALGPSENKCQVCLMPGSFLS